MKWRSFGCYCRNAISPIILAVFLLLQTGCAVTVSNINRLREAQDAFNNAAEIENRARFNMDSPFDRDGRNGISGLVTAQTGYATALHSL